VSQPKSAAHPSLPGSRCAPCARALYVGKSNQLGPHQQCSAWGSLLTCALTFRSASVFLSAIKEGPCLCTASLSVTQGQKRAARSRIDRGSALHVGSTQFTLRTCRPIAFHMAVAYPTTNLAPSGAYCVRVIGLSHERTARLVDVVAASSRNGVHLRTTLARTRLAHVFTHAVNNLLTRVCIRQKRPESTAPRGQTPREAHGRVCIACVADTALERCL